LVVSKGTTKNRLRHHKPKTRREAKEFGGKNWRDHINGCSANGKSSREGTKWSTSITIKKGRARLRTQSHIEEKNLGQNHRPVQKKKEADGQGMFASVRKRAQIRGGKLSWGLPIWKKRSTLEGAGGPM